SPWAGAGAGQVSEQGVVGAGGATGGRRSALAAGSAACASRAGVWKSGRRCSCAAQRCGQFDGQAAAFQHFVERNGREQPLLECFDEGSCTGKLTLVLAPEALARKARPAPAAQVTEVVELQHAAGAEHFQALLGQ